VTEPAAGFRVVSSTAVAEAGFLTLETRHVVGPDGAEFDRHVVRHPGAVVVVPVDGDDALLVRQFRAAVDGDLLELPAGKRDVPGEPPATTAARELAEEIGRTASRMQLLGEFYNSPGFTDELSFVFLATGLTEGERHAVTDEEAAIEVVRVPFADVDALVADGTIRDAKTMIGLLLARGRLAH
jgi:ADP-ribose pyrophosphatase